MRRVMARAPVALVVPLVGLLAAACSPAPLAPRATRPEPPPAFRLGRDTFAFANLVRAERPGERVPFANYCLVMVRAATQVHRFARFDPGRPPPGDLELGRLLADVLARDPWGPPLPAGDRVVIPGYPDLHALSAAREAVVKAALGSGLPSMVHPRTWRVALALSPAHQASVAADLRAEVEAGRPAPLMVTNFPEPDLLNHAVLVYAHRAGAGGSDFLAYDPNDPWSPLGLHFDPAERAFYVGPLPYSPPGRIRAFRLYTSAWF
jgi:hypothetical protein